jgi:hypothetical protein
LSSWRIDLEASGVSAFPISSLGVLRWLRQGTRYLSVVFWASISPRDRSTDAVSTERGKVLFHVSLPMNRSGFEKLVTRVSATSLPKMSILIGMESTACYPISLFSFLMALG